MDTQEALTDSATGPPEPYFGGNPERFLSPLLWSMRCVGLFFHSNDNVSPTNTSCIKCLDSHSAGLHSNKLFPLTIRDNDDKHINTITVLPATNDMTSKCKKYNSWDKNEGDEETSNQQQDKCVNDCIRNPDDSNLKLNTSSFVLPGRLHSKQTFPDGYQGRDNYMNFSMVIFIKRVFNSRSYAIFVTCILWTNVARCVIYIGDSRVVMMVAIGLILWYLMCALNATVLLVSCWNQSHFTAFFHKWRVLYKDKTPRQLGLLGVPSNGYLKYIIVLEWTLVVVNTCFNLLIMTKNDDFSYGLNIVMYIDGQRSVWSIVLSCVVSIFTTMAWVSPVMFNAVICKHLVSHFDQFQRVLRMHIQTAGDRFPPELCELRECHLKMCDLIPIMDEYMKMAMAVIFSISILISCFILNRLIGAANDVSVVVIALCWMAFSLISVGVFTYNASNVHKATTSVLCDLQTVKTGCITQEQNAQLHLFLSKLNGPDIGFTVLGLIVVKRELMLTLLGVFITYAVVLIQLNQ